MKIPPAGVTVARPKYPVLVELIRSLTITIRLLDGRICAGSTLIMMSSGPVGAPDAPPSHQIVAKPPFVCQLKIAVGLELNAPLSVSND